MNPPAHFKGYSVRQKIFLSSRAHLFQMINLCLPMKVINVTQLPGGSYSHPNNCLDLAGSDSGIDFAFALGNYWKCISGPWGSNTYFFSATNNRGVPVKVHCADGIDRIVTVAMTHADFEHVQRPTIGKIYTNGQPFYEEGTHGMATGNHIHYEVAEGLQYGKYRDDAMGVWRMHGELNPVKVCYICDSFSRVDSTHGAQFKHCKSIYTEDSIMEMKTGMNWYQCGDVKLTAYLKPDDYEFGLFNADKPTLIGDIDDPNVQFIEKCGNDFFQMRSDVSDPYGTVYGPRVCVNGPVDQPIVNPEPYLFYRLDKDGTVSMGDYLGEFIDPNWAREHIQMCCSPQMIFNKAWQWPKYAPMAGNSNILEALYHQAYFGRTADGKFFSGKTLARMSAKKVWEFFRDNFDVHDMAFMDGGSSESDQGSAQQIFWDNTTGKMLAVGSQPPLRAVRDILGFYKPLNNEPIEEPEDDEVPSILDDTVTIPLVELNALKDRINTLEKNMQLIKELANV